MLIHAGAMSARVTRLRASLTAVLTTAQLPRMPQNDCTPQTSSSRSSMQAVSASGPSMAAMTSPMLMSAALRLRRYPPAAPRCAVSRSAFVSIFSSLDTVGWGSIRSSDRRAADAGSSSANESLVSRITA